MGLRGGLSQEEEEAGFGFWGGRGVLQAGFLVSSFDTSFPAAPTRIPRGKGEGKKKSFLS